MLGTEPTTVQSMYIGQSMFIDGKATLAFPAPVEKPVAQPVVLGSQSESSARFRGRTMISADRLTAGYGLGGASAESIASAAHSKGTWYAEFTVRAGSGKGVPHTWTDVGIRSTANENGGLISHDGQLAYGREAFLEELGRAA